MIPDQAELRKLSDEAAAHVLNMEGTQSGTRTGWLMITTILIEAWDLYSISFLLIFVKDEFKPSPALLGLTSASVQLGALIGAMIGGWAACAAGAIARMPSAMTTDAGLRISTSKDGKEFQARVRHDIECAANSVQLGLTGVRAEVGAAASRTSPLHCRYHGGPQSIDRIRP